ncbi:hypothetical protein Q5752_002479 [Cryptotrichosporon argae]
MPRAHHDVSEPFGTFTRSGSSWHTQQYPPPGSPHAIDVNIVLPVQGVIFMEPSDDARAYAQLSGATPVWDTVLTGEAKFTLGQGTQKMRYSRIKVGVFSKAYLDLPGGREVNELFNRDITNDDGGVLEPGTTLNFAFSLILPSTLAPRDRIGNNHVVTNVYAEIIGTRPSGPDRSPSPPRSRPTAASSLAGLVSRASSSLMSLTLKPAAPAPRPPAYDPTCSSESQRLDVDIEHESVGAPPWLQGTFRGEHIARLVYNPDPAGAVTELDEPHRGHVDGLGQYDIQLYSDVWTIAAMLRATLVLSDVPPTTTVYSFRVSIDQTTEVRSPLSPPTSAPSATFKRRFLLLEQGRTPDLLRGVPVANAPALWRGAEAAGAPGRRGQARQAMGGLQVECDGRVLQDGDNFDVRASTPLGVNSPIHVSHAFVVQVLFSTWGVSADGKAMATPGPGDLRELRITRHTFVPSCALASRVLQLPDYEHPEQVSGEVGTRGRWLHCACDSSDAELRERMRLALERRGQSGTAQQAGEAGGEAVKAETAA